MLLNISGCLLSYDLRAFQRIVISFPCSLLFHFALNEMEFCSNETFRKDVEKGPGISIIMRHDSCDVMVPCYNVTKKSGPGPFVACGAFGQKPSTPDNWAPRV